MEEFLNKLSAGMDTVSNLITQYAPQALDMTLRVVQAQGIMQLALGAVFGVIAIVTATFLGRKFRAAMRQADPDDPDVFFVTMFGCMGMVIVTLGGAALSLDRLLNLYYWFSAFEPIAALAYKALPI